MLNVRKLTISLITDEEIVNKAENGIEERSKKETQRDKEVEPKKEK